jgi:hypothetical protein
VERVALSCLAVIQLWALWARSWLHPLLFFTHFTWDYSLRLLLFLLVFAGRYHIFHTYRRPGVLAAAFAAGFAGPFTFYLIFQWPSGQWYLAGLAVIDYAVLAVFYGVIIEFTAVIMGELWQKERPFGYDLALPDQRLLAAEKGLATHLKLTLYWAFILCLGLYALHTSYIFNWTIYSQAAVLFLLLFFFLPLVRLQVRLRGATAPERQAVTEKLSRLYLQACAASSFPVASAAGCREEIIMLCLYHDFLLASATLPWRWDHLLSLGGGFLLLLSQPALIRLFLPG